MKRRLRNQETFWRMRDNNSLAYCSGAFYITNDNYRLSRSASKFILHKEYGLVL